MPFEDQEPGAALPVALRPEHVEQERIKRLQDEKDAAEHQRIADFNAHPHTRLTGMLADLSTKRVDMHDRIGALHRVLSRLLQHALSLTPPPYQENEDEKRIEEQPAVRPEGQFTPGS